MHKNYVGTLGELKLVVELGAGLKYYFLVAGFPMHFKAPIIIGKRDKKTD